ncbi:fic/DOC family domain-containing protein [Ditylenchus destructor]|nr:fic/DOC family domain-containing protein [Ditylenchus destructor]
MHHKILEHSDGKYAGKLRDCGVAIGNLNTPLSNDVPKLVNEMLQFCNSMCDDLHPIDLAAFTHYFALAIHGFADGNGRTSRMLQNVILSRYGFPPITIKVDEKQQYYFRLRSSHSAYAGDCRIFLDYIASEMEKTISGLIEIANSETNYSTTHQINLEGKE